MAEQADNTNTASIGVEVETSDTETACPDIPSDTVKSIVSGGRPLRFADLFAGLGGTRIGFELAAKKLGIPYQCVYTSDKKPSAARVYARNFGCDTSGVLSDITKVPAESIPPFDVMLGGFPCQPFSQAGARRGFDDTRGTLFFDIARILAYHSPEYFVLENVENIMRHDNGRTIEVIKRVLGELDYNIDIRVFDASQHGCAQRRRRTFIVGSKHVVPHLSDIPDSKPVVFGDIRERGKVTVDDDFTRKLLAVRKANTLRGAILLDKRNGANTIHSWDFDMRGPTTKRQKRICNWLLENHRKRCFADELGVEWRDGMPLNLDQISRGTEIPVDVLATDIQDLVAKKYLVARYPYCDGSLKPRTDLPLGYRIDTSRLNFEFNRILDDDAVAHTLTATDSDRCGVVDGNGIRHLTRRECLRLFGFPEWYEIDERDADDRKMYDLIGNAICVPVVEKVVAHLLTI